MTIYDVLTDFACASLLILIGQFLRSKVKFFQTFFVPASLIGGFLGLFLGPRVLSILPFSSGFGSYAGCFIIIVFTVVGVNGFDIEKSGGGKETIKRLFGYEMFRQVGFFVQFAIPIAVTLLVLLKIFPDLNPAFGVLLASGFTGGHGTAAAVGKTLADLGWADGNDLAITFATAGILTGIFGGLALIKLATIKEWTCYVKDIHQLSPDLKTGLVTKENRQSFGDETISSVSLDTLCFHMALIMLVGGGGYLLNQKVLAPFVIKGIPDFTVSYLVGLAFFMLFKKTPAYNYVDKRINTRISGMFTDYLVCFAVASINPAILVTYAGPLIIMTLIGIIIVFFTVLPFGWLLNKETWFEHSIFVYGYLTGVFAIGFVLLRIVDPENKSMTVEDTAMTPFLNFAEIVVWSAVPTMLIAGQGWTVVVIFTLGIIASIVAAIIFKTWYPASKYLLDAKSRGGFGIE